jgi:hypothetical protein
VQGQLCVWHAKDLGVMKSVGAVAVLSLLGSLKYLPCRDYSNMMPAQEYFSCLPACPYDCCTGAHKAWVDRQPRYVEQVTMQPMLHARTLHLYHVYIYLLHILPALCS